MIPLYYIVIRVLVIYSDIWNMFRKFPVSECLELMIDPFYALDNVGLYTFYPYKVVWREQKSSMMACVISTKADIPLKGKLIIPDSKVLFCPFKSIEEAHYLCAMLNSIPVRYIIESYTIETQRGLDILNNLKIPEYNPNDKRHKRLSELSLKAHTEFPNEKVIANIEKEIDRILCDLFELNLDEIEMFYQS